MGRNKQPTSAHSNMGASLRMLSQRSQTHKRTHGLKQAKLISGSEPRQWLPLTGWDEEWEELLENTGIDSQCVVQGPLSIPKILQGVCEIKTFFVIILIWYLLFFFILILPGILREIFQKRHDRWWCHRSDGRWNVCLCSCLLNFSVLTLNTVNIHKYNPHKQALCCPHSIF